MAQKSRSNEPNWDFWLAMPKVQLWQAIALSMNMDPDKTSPPNDFDAVTGIPVFEGASFPVSGMAEPFSKRVRLLSAYLSERQYFSAPTINLKNEYRHEIRTKEFAAWAVRFLNKPPIPSRLAAIAEPPKNDAGAGARPSDAPIGRHAWQEQQILAVIEQLGHSRLALPKLIRGEKGVKHDVLAKCSNDNPDKWLGTIFDKAWDRLLSQKKTIKYAE